MWQIKRKIKAAAEAAIAAKMANRFISFGEKTNVWILKLNYKLTGPWATNEFNTQTNCSIVLTVWINSNFRCDYYRLQHILNFTVGVNISRQNL